MNRKQRRAQIKRYNYERGLGKHGYKTEGATGGLVPAMRWSMAPKITKEQNEADSKAAVITKSYLDIHPHTSKYAK